MGPYLPKEAFTVQEALDSFTKTAAFSSFDEKNKGQILPGMLADFVILGENPFQAAPNAIKDIQVLATVLEGCPVFTAPGSPV